MSIKENGYWSAVLISALLLGAVAGACGDSASDTAEAPPGSGSDDGGLLDASLDQNSSDGPSSADALFVESGPSQTALLIDPVDPVLDVTGAAPPTVQFSVRYNDNSVPQAVNWSIEDVAVGTLSSAGLFSAKGAIAGKAKVTAQVGSLTVSTSVTVRVKLSANPMDGEPTHAVSDADAALLRAGGSADTDFRWLYPYDRTIFPQGLASPSLQLGGTPADAVRVKIVVGDFEYEGLSTSSGPIRIALPQAIWDGMTRSAKGTDSVQVSVSKISAGAVSGPVQESWRIAQGSLKGIIYYNTYNSVLSPGGGVMRIRPGSQVEVLVPGCTVCHSVASSGSRLASSVSWSGDGHNGIPGSNPVSSGVWDLGADGSATQVYTDVDGRKSSFAALSPDGQWMITNGVPQDGGPIQRGLTGPYPSRLYNTATGAEVDAPSFSSAVQYALTPVFSPDAKRLAFNWRDSSPGHLLAMFDVDLNQSPPAFSNLQTLYTSQKVAGWPSFTSDSQAIVFHEGDSFDTGTWGGGALYADLRILHVPSKTVVSLDNANGIAAGQSALPYGEAEDGHLNYEPTLLPVPVGGYYWMIFTSRRSYGNTVCNTATNPHGCEVPGGNTKFGTTDGANEFPSPRKKLWVAAIDVGWDGTVDPSHPAFYLPGQELEAGNMRAFAALEPCKALGASCESGAECCNGFCRQNGENDAGQPVFQCVTPPAGCSNVDESCHTAADCCDAPNGYLCVNNRCTMPAPPR